MFNENYKKVNDIENCNSNKYWVSYNDHSYYTKPIAKELKKMTHEFISKELSLIDIAKELQAGKSFCRVKLKDNHRCNESFESFQLIWCDIDGEYCINEFLDICNKYNIIPSVLYPTFSDTGEFNRFRAIFKLNKQSSDLRNWYLISHMMDFIFNFKDNSNTSPSQQYYGTDKDVYIFNDYKNYNISLENILLATIQKLNSIDSKTARRKLQQLHERTGVNANTKSINVLDLGDDIILDYLVEHDEFKKLKLKYKTKVCKGPIPKGVRPDYKVSRVDLNTLVNRCDLMKKFINLEYLNHHERTYLGNMFYYIEQVQYKDDVYGGVSWYLSVLKQLIPIYKVKSKKLNNSMTKSYDDVVDGINGVNRSGVIWNCEKSCSSYVSCENNCKNILSLCKVDAPIRNKSSINTSKLSDVENRFRSDYSNLIGNLNDYKKRKTEISIFNIETGIGKTEVIVNTKYNVPTLIAVPTHDLKDELYKRIIEAGVNTPEDILIIPERPEIEDEDIKFIISNYEKIGLYDKSHALYKEYANNQFELGNILHTEYLEIMKDIKNTPHRIAITTHKRVIVSDIAKDYMNIIFDEDPSDNIIVSNSALFDDINKLEAIGNRNNWKDFILEGFRHFRRLINTSIDNNQLFVKNEIGFNYKSSFKDIPFDEMPKTNIFGAMNRDTYIYIDRLNPNGTTLNYLYTHDMSNLNNRNIVILSATPNMAKISKVFEGSEIYRYDYPRCEKKGVIIQDLTHSFSKYSLYNNFDKLVKHIDKNHKNKSDLVLITYMKFKNKFEKYGFNVDEMVHFGNCEGYDHLKGKDLIIVGRMYSPLEHYKLISWYLGDVDLEELDKLNFISRRTNINGFEVTLHCFDDDRVNKYLFYDIEKNLEQAIGRARALRENCKVYIYTNYPMALANKYKYLGDIV